MNNIFKKTAYLVLVITSVIFFSCTVKVNDTHSENASETVDKSGPEYTSAYICPMHCEGSGASEMGSCPVCKMDLVKNENYKENAEEEMEEEQDSVNNQN